jgi:hypothetical protein
MEDKIKDSILDGISDDPVLDQLVALTLNEILRGRPLFLSPLDEPYFYQKNFRRWVEEGLEEYRKANETEAKNVRGLQETQFSA